MNKKHLTQTVTALLIAITALAGCKKEDNPVKVSVVSLNKATLTLDVGESETLTATVMPADAENKTVTWAVTAGDAATVDAGGKVTAVKAGTANITVTTTDGGFTATCTVTVQTETVNEPENTMTMTMTTAKEGDIEIHIAGVGTAIIDWGDGSEPKTVVFSPLARYPDIYSHAYSGASPRTITISGRFITHLYCNKNGLTALDVSNNTNLVELECYDNQLTALDVTKNTALTHLNCGYLYYGGNQLTSLDVSNNTALTYLHCENNQLTAEGLNALFVTLHSNYTGWKTIYITDNPGFDYCDKTIAEAKGWEVN